MTTIDFYLNDKWTQTINKIAESGQIAESVLPYFSSKLVSLSDTEAVVTVPAFINFAIMSDNMELIENCFEDVFKRKIAIRLVQQDDFDNRILNKADSFNNDFLSRKIDPNQTFADFVVGRSNAQAQVAAMTCASNLGYVFNPLFISILLELEFESEV